MAQAELDVQFPVEDPPPQQPAVEQRDGQPIPAAAPPDVNQNP